MLRDILRALALAGVLAGTALQPGALAKEPESANAALFEVNHLDKVGKGEELHYRFQRTVSEAKILGQPFSDDIKVAVTGVGADGLKEVRIDIFTGERARDPQTEPNRTGNPIVVVFLERAVNNFGILAGSNRNYVKQQFIKALRDRGKLEPVSVEYKGKTVSGYRMVLEPFRGDRYADRMDGYDISRFSFVMSDEVPGYFVEMASNYESSKPHAPKLDERITLAGTGAIK
jgi:hypothetical protein